MAKLSLRVPEKCGDVSAVTFKTYTLPFDFPTNAEFFVAAGVSTILFTIIITFIYVFMHRLYSTNQVTSIVDFVATCLLSVFSLAATCFWAVSVFDIEYYANPSNFFKDLDICNEPKVCQNVHSANLVPLYVSLIFGFANCVLWISSVWFVYKETSFHQRIKAPPQKWQQHQVPPIPLPENTLKSEKNMNV